MRPRFKVVGGRILPCLGPEAKLRRSFPPFSERVLCCGEEVRGARAGFGVEIMVIVEHYTIRAVLGIVVRGSKATAQVGKVELMRLMDQHFEAILPSVVL